MLTWRNDPLLVDSDEVEPSKFVTVNDLMSNGKKHLLFLDKDEKILNLYSALVKRIDFVRSEGSYILGRMPYVNGEKLETIMRNLPSFHGKNDYFQLRESITTYLGLKRKIKPSELYLWMGNIVPLPVLRATISVCYPEAIEQQHKILASLLSQDLIITNSHGQGRFTPPAELSQLLDTKFSYFVGLIAGDGYLRENRVMTISDGTRHTEELHYSYKFLRKIKRFLKNEFLLDSSLDLHKNVWILIISNKWFCRFINFFFGLSFGKKYTLEIPAIFSLSNKEDITNAFWRGFFDAEGSMSSGLSVSSKHLNLLQKCQSDLKKSGITSWKMSRSNKGFRLDIHTSGLLHFAESIGFLHPRKQELLTQRLLSDCKETTFVGINTNRMIANFFDLSIIPLRIYGASKFFLELRKNLGLSQRETAKTLKVNISRISDWENGKSGIPIDKMLFLAFKSNYTKLDFYSKLENYNVRCGVGKRTKPVKLPLKLSDDLLSISENVRSSPPKLHINKSFGKGFADEDNLLRKIEKFFNVKPRMERGGRYRIDSKPLAEFFRNFFVYRPAWKSLTIEQIRNLKNQWNCLGV